MGLIFCVMGKSATGKDTIYGKLLKNGRYGLETIVPYTTRPIREGEEEGREYHFTDEEGFAKLSKEGKVIEDRAYNTVHGLWRYFTVSDGIFPDRDYIIIGTLQQYSSLKDYYGAERVCPIYVELDDGARLQRALDREKKQKEPKYTEMCRRFLADSEDFSEENLRKAGIEKRFVNDDIESCVTKIEDYIGTVIGCGRQ